MCYRSRGASFYAFIIVFEHLKFGKKATMNWTTNWGQFVVAKHDTKYKQ